MNSSLEVGKRYEFGVGDPILVKYKDDKGYVIEFLNGSRFYWTFEGTNTHWKEVKPKHKRWIVMYKWNGVTHVSLMVCNEPPNFEKRIVGLLQLKK